MADKLMNQCVEAELEYRDWKECPLWYCVKTIFNHASGKLESEIVKDEKTKLPVAIQDADKPADGVFETPTATIYYTYCRGYKAAERQLMAAAI